MTTPDLEMTDSDTRAMTVQRVGVVGAGEQAATHLIPALQRLDGVRLAAVADPEPDRLAATARRFTIPIGYPEASQMLAEARLDAVIAACPPQVHEEIAVMAIECGVPVFVEKPPAVTSRALRSLAMEAERANVLTGVGMNFRHAGPYRRVKELLTQPEVGAPVSISIRHVASKPKGSLWGLPPLRSFLLAQAIHPVDLLLDLGGPVVDVHAVHRVDGGEVVVGIQAEFAGGAVGSIMCGTHAPRFDTRIEVITSTGVLISLAGLSELTVAGLPAAAAAGGSRGWSQQWRPSPLDTGYERTGFHGELEAFLSAVAAGTPFRPGLADLLPAYDSPRRVRVRTRCSPLNTPSSMTMTSRP